jgi:hypothetical protein
MLKYKIIFFIVLTTVLEVSAQRNYLESLGENKLSSLAFTRSGNNLVVATTYLLDSVNDVNGRCVPILAFANSETGHITYTAIGDTTRINDEMLFVQMIEVLNDSMINIIGNGVINFYNTPNDFFVFKIKFNIFSNTAIIYKYPIISKVSFSPRIINVKKISINNQQIYYGVFRPSNDDIDLSSFFIKTDLNDSLLFHRIESGEKDNVYGYPLGTIINRNDSLVAFNTYTNHYGEINLLDQDSFKILSQFQFWRGFSPQLGQNNLYSTNRCEISTQHINNNIYQLIVSDTLNELDGLFERYSIRKLNVNNYNITHGTVLFPNFDFPHDDYYANYWSMNNALLVNESRNTVFAYLNSINTKQQFILYKFDTALNITWYKDFVFDQNNLYNRYTVEDMLQTDDGVYLIGKITDRSVNPLVQKSFLYFISNDGHVTGINNKELVAFTSYIYPNPAQTNFNIPTGTQKVNIINNVGQLVLNTDNPNNNTVDISMLQPGIYIVQLFINNQWVSNKLVKQ